MRPPTTSKDASVSTPAGGWSPALLRGHLLAADASLLTALAWTAWRPGALLESALHPQVLACVHLITLGFLATACIGAFHVVMPLSMRASVRASVFDWSLLATVQIVATGVASHMLLQTYSGVSWSAALLFALLLVQAIRLGRLLLAAKAPLAMRLGSALAWLNLLLVVVLGGGMALHRTSPWLPRDWLQTIAAHAHLALCGFAGTLVAAVGTRLLPMFLPAAPPPQPLALAAVVGLGAGGLLRGASALSDSWQPAGDWLLIGGAVAWFANVGTMLLRRRPAPPALRRPLPFHLLLGTGGACFLAATIYGVLLVLGVCGPATWSLYGALLLLGGFGSFVFGIGQRLLPMAVRLAYAEGDAHRMPSALLSWITAACWTSGIAGLVAALLASSPWLLRAAVSLLALAVVADFVNLIHRRARAARLVSCSPP